MATAKYVLVALCSVLSVTASPGRSAEESRRDQTSDTAVSIANPVGQPDRFDQGKASLYALWYDEGVWRLRVTTRNKGKERFTGTVRVNGGRISRGEFQGLEKAKRASNADWVLPHRDGKGFDFHFMNVGKTDGINFKVSDSATNVTFKLLIDGGEYPRRIQIGAKAQHPEKVPFVLPAHPGG